MAYLTPQQQRPGAWADALPRPRVKQQRYTLPKPAVPAVAPEMQALQTLSQPPKPVGLPMRPTQPIQPALTPAKTLPAAQKSILPDWGGNNWDSRSGWAGENRDPVGQSEGDFYDALSGRGQEDIQFYTPLQYGFPFIDSIMPHLGFERWRDPRTGRWYWRPGPYQEYDKAAVDREMVGVRDALEPEMLRQLAGAEGDLAKRGLSRSSLQGGVQSGMRGDFVKNLIKARLQLIKEEKARRWQERMQTLGGITDMGALLSQRKPEEPSGLETLLSAGASIVPFL